MRVIKYPLITVLTTRLLEELVGVVAPGIPEQHSSNKPDGAPTTYTAPAVESLEESLRKSLSWLVMNVNRYLVKSCDQIFL